MALTDSSDALAAFSVRTPADQEVVQGFQTSLRAAYLWAIAAIAIQSLLVLVVRTTYDANTLLRMALNAGWAISFAVALRGPLRAGKLEAAALYPASWFLVQNGFNALHFGFVYTPMPVVLGTVMLLWVALFCRRSVLVGWCALYFAELFAGYFGAVQQAGVRPVLLFSATVMSVLVIGLLLYRYRTILLAMLFERSAQARVAEGVNAQLRQVIAERDQLEMQRYNAQRIEAMGRLAGGISHDFNNILTIMSSSVELLREAGPAYQADLDQLDKAVQRGAGLTRQLLAFARQQPALRAQLDLAAMATELHPMLERLAAPQSHVVTDAQGPAVVDGDRAQLEQVLFNLVANARDAMAKGGTIQVVVRRDDAAVPPEAMLTVRDGGAGIPLDARSHIFEPFFTTKREHGGTGLGLSTCHGIVQQHGGTLTVESTEGVGSTFTLRLPLLPSVETAQQLAEPPTSP